VFARLGIACRKDLRWRCRPVRWGPRQWSTRRGARRWDRRCTSEAGPCFPQASVRSPG